MTEPAKARPILFSTPMVQALLEGRKTQTRRVVKHPRGSFVYTENNRVVKSHELDDLIADSKIAQDFCPYGAVGDLLWVRESIRRSLNPLTPYWGIYAADNKEACEVYPWKRKTLPSIHMPKGLSRLTLEITDIRIEQLQNISAEDAIREGYSFDAPPVKSKIDYINWFKNLWQSINGKESWDSNPWVWVIKFKVHKCNVDDYLRRTK